MVDEEYKWISVLILMLVIETRWRKNLPTPRLHFAVAIHGVKNGPQGVRSVLSFGLGTYLIVGPRNSESHDPAGIRLQFAAICDRRSGRSRSQEGQYSYGYLTGR